MLSASALPGSAWSINAVKERTLSPCDESKSPRSSAPRARPEWSRVDRRSGSVGVEERRDAEAGANQERAHQERDAHQAQGTRLGRVHQTRNRDPLVLAEGAGRACQRTLRIARIHWR